MKSEGPLVDTHFHVYTRDMPLEGDAWHEPPEDASIERMIRTLDESGVQFGVMSAASLFGDYNDYTRLAMQRHPGRLKGTAIVPPRTDIRILEQMKAEGFCGIRFQWRYLKELPDLKAPEYRLLLRRVRDLGWHVHLHDNSPRLAGPIAAIEAAGVPLVIDHFGRPDPKTGGVNCPGFRAMLAALERGKAWVKLSAGFRFEPAEAKAYATELLKFGGGERLFWGSDWPFAAFESKVKYADTVAMLEDWVPDARVRRQIGAETPLKFYFGR